MTKKTLMSDIEAMEQVMSRTANRTDIWQDRCVYAMAKAIWDILHHIRRKEMQEDK